MKNKFKISSPFLSDFIPENIWEIFWICLPYSLRLYREDILNLLIRIYREHIWIKFKINTLVSFKIWSQFLLGECREEIKNIHSNINREQILNVTFPVWKCTRVRVTLSEPCFVSNHNSIDHLQERSGCLDEWINEAPRQSQPEVSAQKMNSICRTSLIFRTINNGDAIPVIKYFNATRRPWTSLRHIIPRRSILTTTMVHQSDSQQYLSVYDLVLDSLQAFRAPFGLLNLNRWEQRGQKPWILFQKQPSFNLTCILSLKPETRPLLLERTFLGKKIPEKSVPSETVGKKPVLSTIIQ